MTARAVIGGVDRHLGAWRPSPLKLRGIAPSFDLAALPLAHDILGFPTGYDQGQLGSCGPNSVAEVLEYQTRTKLSRLFLYFFTRADEHDIFEDGGVVIPDMLAVAHTMGMPLESLHPYDVGLYEEPPSIAALYDAYQRRVARWDVVADLNHILYELTHGQPVTFGFGVPASMQSDECARTGLVAVPSAGDPMIGGHCVNAIGFDRARRLIKATCHYGEDFGDGGCIWLPFDHVLGGNASDFSAIRAPGFVA